jgi:cytochrome P450
MVGVCQCAARGDPESWDNAAIHSIGLLRRSIATTICHSASDPSICIDAGFALQEATLALASSMRNFNITLAPGQTVWPQQQFTLRPRDPLLLRVEPR